MKYYKEKNNKTGNPIDRTDIDAGIERRATIIKNIFSGNLNYPVGEEDMTVIL